MEFELIDNGVATEDSLALRESAGWGRRTKEQEEKGLQNSLFTVAAKIGGRTVGMGRLLGDACSIWYIQDLIVYPEQQGQGIGKAIMNRLIAYAKANSLPGTTITLGLMAAKDKEPFYTKLGFRTRPNDREGAGMMMNIKVSDT